MTKEATLKKKNEGHDNEYVTIRIRRRTHKKIKIFGAQNECDLPTAVDIKFNDIT